MSRKPPTAAMIPSAILRTAFTAGRALLLFPGQPFGDRVGLVLCFGHVLLDDRAMALVARVGLQFGEQLGDLAGDGDGLAALCFDRFFGFGVGELFGLVLGFA